MKNSPTQTRRKQSPVVKTSPAKTPAKIGLNSTLLILALIIAIPCVGAWSMWKNIRPDAPAPAAFGASVQQTNNTAPAVPSLPAPVAKDAQGAAQAFAEARAQEKYIIGPWRPTFRMLALAQKAVELDSTKPAYLVFLMQNYVSLRRSKEAIATGRQLLALKPDHRWGSVMLANQLLDNGAKADEYPQIEAMLRCAEPDPNLAPALHYGRGLLALRRKQANVAVTELKKACELAPYSSAGFYNLFLAEKMAGDEPAAARAMAQHDICVKRNTDALKEKDRLTQRPETLQDYVRSIRGFEAKGLKEPADAYRDEGHKKYGAALDVALGKKTPPSTKP